MFNVNIFDTRAWKSEIHEHYHRKNCKKYPGAFVNIQLWWLNESLFVTQDVNFQLEREGIKKKEKMVGGGGGGGDNFKYVCQREAINRGATIIRGNTVSAFEESDTVVTFIWSSITNSNTQPMCCKVQVWQMHRFNQSVRLCKWLWSRGQQWRAELWGLYIWTRSELAMSGSDVVIVIYSFFV